MRSSKQEFQELLQRYLRGASSAEEIRKIEAWYASLGMDEPEELLEEEKQQMQKRIQHGIIRRTGQASRLRYLYAVGVAASILLVVAWGGYTYQVTQRSISTAPLVKKKAPAHERLNTKNTTTQELSLALEDGSTVVLAPGSSLSYPVHFAGDRREVELIGDAFFEIARQPKRPFLVYCGGAVTQVLGTSFWVKTTRESGAIEVAVKTGRVSVYEHPSARQPQVPDGPAPSNGVILTPNQKVIFFPKERHLVTSLVEVPTLLPTVKVPYGFSYNDTTLEEVLSEFEKGYGIQIVLLSEKLKNCTFSGDLSGLSLDEKLLLICKSVGATHELIGTDIVINGPGCD